MLKSNQFSVRKENFVWKIIENKGFRSKLTHSGRHVFYCKDTLLIDLEKWLMTECKQLEIA